MSFNGRALAIAEAQRQGCDLNIVLATIEAESSFSNIMGDDGKAYGYGQVWYMYWSQNFDYAAKILGIQLPTDSDSLSRFVLQNDQFSMILAVKTIKDVWLKNNKNWHDFTLSYVGYNIPQNDYNRRLSIWNNYNNNSDMANISSTLSSGGANIFNSQNVSDAGIPETKLGVVPNSKMYGNILFGRRYRILVTNAHGTALDVSQLRCTFNVNKTIQMQPNMSEVTIYNLEPNTENTIINEGEKIIIEAGYEGEQYGKIFTGDIIQPIRDKEDGVTFKLTLTSMDGDRFFNGGFVSFSYTRGQTHRDMITDLVTKASIPSKLGSISENLSNQKLTRGKVICGLARDYLRQIALSQNASFYIEDDKVNMIRLDDIPTEAIELSPQSGLIGTPAQTQYGLSFKCLLNPRIKLNTFVHIDNKLVREQKFTPAFQQLKPGTKPQTQPIRQLDGDGLYRVISINHIGDTRGEDWYTECICISQAGLLPGLVSDASMNAF